MAQMQTKKSTFWASIVEFIFLLAIVFLIRTIGFGLYQVPTGSMETTMLVGERFFADKFTYLFKKPEQGEIIAFNDPKFVYSDNRIIEFFQQYVWGPSNWTKRVIGVPGNWIRGVIEGGEPVIYRNGKKLDELYLNQYPLIHVWKQDPDELRRQIEMELEGMFLGRKFDNTVIDNVVAQKLGGQTTFRSYVPECPFDQQPFYRIIPERVMRGEKGEFELLFPKIATYAKTADSLNNSQNYWSGTDEFSVQLGDDEYWLMGDNRRGSYDSRVLGPIKGKHIHGRIIFRIWSIDSDEAWWIFDLIKHPIDFWTRIRWNRFFQLVR